MTTGVGVGGRASLPPRRRGRRDGFTLIELLVVIIVLGVLAAIVVFAVRGVGDRGKAAAIQADETTIRTAVEAFCGKNGRYPGGPAAPDPFKGDPMGELVAGKFLSNRSEYYVLTTGDNPTGDFPEGKCPATPKNFKLSPGPGQLPQFFGGVSGGQDHSLRLTTDGKVFASGSNYLGQLGDGSYDGKLLPVPSGLSGVKAVAAGAASSLALTNGGTVLAWGLDSSGNGDSTATPVQVKGGDSGDFTNVTAIAAPDKSGAHALALRGDGTVWAWGSNGSGQLGNGSTTHSSTPVQVSGLGDVAAIDAGSEHSLALKNDGTVWSWGGNAYRQLGDGTTVDRTAPVPVAGLGGGVTAIASGDYHSVALKSDGTVWVWGQQVSRWNSLVNAGQERFDSTAPAPLGNFGGVTAIASGSGHVLASKNGEVWAWGNNDSGQLGNDSTSASATPVQVKGFNGAGSLLDAVFLDGGDSFSMAAMRDGRVLTWGNNRYGQLGIGSATTTSPSSPAVANAIQADSQVPVGPYPPANDAFAAAVAITGSSGTVNGTLPRRVAGLSTNKFATREEGEPGHRPGNLSSGGASVWYRWTAPATGPVTFSTANCSPATTSCAGSTFNTTMGAYTGAGVSALVTVAQNDDIAANNLQSRVTFNATQGSVYYIAIDGNVTGAEGAIRLAWNP